MIIINKKNNLKNLIYIYIFNIYVVYKFSIYMYFINIFYILKLIMILYIITHI